MKRVGFIFCGILVLLGIIYAESLWDEKGNIYSTEKMWEVGDSIKIIFNERSLVDYRTANSEMQKVSAQAQGGTGALINFLPSIGGSDNFETTQRASTRNKTQLGANISVQITKILPTGNLQIEGTHSIIVNNQTENIAITGEVNPKDIKKKKYVYSTDVLNAAINYQSKIIKPEIVKPGDYVQTFTTNISVVSGKTQVNVTSQYSLSDDKKNQLIIEYLNKILSILFRK